MIFGWPLGPPSLESPSEEDESPAPTQCLDKRVIACLCGRLVSLHTPTSKRAGHDDGDYTRREGLR